MGVKGRSSQTAVEPSLVWTFDDRDWPCVQVVDWLELVLAAQTFSGLARGQSKASWPLRPSLPRLAREASALPTHVEAISSLIESVSTTDFRAEAPVHLLPQLVPPRDASEVHWWAVMQHHGAPSRLLNESVVIISRV